MQALLVCPDSDLSGQFQSAAAAYPTLGISKSLGYYPSADAFRRLVRVHGPDIVFLSLEDVLASGTLSEQLEVEFPSVQRIALSHFEAPAILRSALRFKMSDLLVPPFGSTTLGVLVEHLTRHLELHPAKSVETGHFFAFMPAKGGVGASTIAANAAASFGDLPDASVLLADFDVYSGTTGFLFNTQHDFSLRDAASPTNHMDDESWRRLVRKTGNLDLLLSGAPALDHDIDDAHLTPVLDFIHRNYSVVCADVADTLDDRTLAVLREATRIFLVATPDLAALRMAKLKAMSLRKLDWEHKSTLILNRASKAMELSTEEVEKIVGIRVFATFPSEYADVTRAAREGRPSQKLAAHAREFVDKALDRKRGPEKRRFIERFAVVPARYAFK